MKQLEDCRQALWTRIEGYSKIISNLKLDAMSGVHALSNLNTARLAEEDVLLQDIYDKYPEAFSADSIPESLNNNDGKDSDADTILPNCSGTLDPSPTPELMAIWLPSSNPNTTADLCSIELQLRKAQADEALNNLQINLGAKSVLICVVTQQNRDAGQHKKGCAWKEVNSTHAAAVKSWATYRRAQEAILALSNSDHDDHYRPVSERDLKELQDITEANQAGQRSDTLPWFWTVRKPGVTESDWLSQGVQCHSLYS